MMEIPSWLHPQVQEAISADAQAAFERGRPFMLMLQHIRIFPEGNQWCVLFGLDLHDGVAGFGDTPDAASRDFDHQWQTSRLKAHKVESPASPVEETKEQGQGQRCQTCNHHRLYHSSIGPCMVLNCQCQEWN